MEEVLLPVSYFGEWVEQPKAWTWIPRYTNTSIISVSKQVTYDELVDIIIEEGQLRFNPSDIVIKYMTNCASTRFKVCPTLIESDRHVQIYMRDVIDGSRSLLCVSSKSLTQGIQRGEEYDSNDPMNCQNNTEVNDREDDCMVTPEDEYICDVQAMPTPTPTPTPTLLPLTQSSHVYDDGTSFVKGQSFKTKKEMLVALKMAAVKKSFMFKTVKSTKTLYVGSCGDNSCRWRIRAMKYKSSDRFYISKYNNEHTCGVQHISSHHPHASANVIGEFMKSKFIEGKGPSTGEIENCVRTELGCKVSYWKCWMGKEIAKSLIRGTHEHGYAVMEAYRHVLESVNPGSKTTLKLDSNGRFKYFFVAYGSCIRGFLSMRKVVAVDGTFLTGKFRGVMLTAVGQDTENHTYPLAFGVVNSENDNSWQWFFEQLLDIVPNNEELCIISDRHKSIVKAVSSVYDRAHHGYCMRHLGENIRVKFKRGDLIELYYRAAKAYTIDEFSDHFQQIRDNDNCLADYLEFDVGFHKWSRSHFHGNRYDVMTTNIAESVNSMFLTEREFPINALFDAISRRLGEKFCERREEMVGLTTQLVPSAEKKIRENMKLGDTLFTYQLAAHEFIVRGYGGDATVNLNMKTCSCRRFDLEKIPCPHAMAALKHHYGSGFGSSIYSMSSPYFSVNHYTLAYAEPIYPVPSEEHWIVPSTIQEINISPPSVSSNAGRIRKKRIPSTGEFSRKRQNKCSFCKRFGHKRTTCPGLRSMSTETSQPSN